MEEFPDLNRDYLREIQACAEEIISSPSYRMHQEYRQHKDVSVYEHCIRVACKALEMADRSKEGIDRKSLIKAALLHDYFQYDWHEKDSSHRLHGLHHPKKAASNAKRDFGLTQKEENAIRSHMWPLGSAFPKSKEAWIIFWADKECAFKETFSNGNRK